MISEDGYNKALMLVRQAYLQGLLPNGNTAGKSHVKHGGKPIPDDHGYQLIAEAQADGASGDLIRKMRKAMDL